MASWMTRTGVANIFSGVFAIANNLSLAALVVLSCVRRLRMQEIKTVNGVSTYDQLPAVAIGESRFLRSGQFDGCVRCASQLIYLAIDSSGLGFDEGSLAGTNAAMD